MWHQTVLCAADGLVFKSERDGAYTLPTRSFPPHYKFVIWAFR